MTHEQVKRKIEQVLGFNQEQIADKLGVTSAFMTRYFQGKSKSGRVDRRLARMLRVPLSEMPGQRERKRAA